MTMLILSECVCASAVSLQYVLYCSLQRCLRCGDEWKGLRWWREVTPGVGSVVVCTGFKYCVLHILYLQFVL